MADSDFRRIQPFKIVAFFMIVISFILTIVSLAGPDWVSVSFFDGEAQSWGLWWDCFEINKSLELCVSSDWLKACIAMVFFSLLADFVSMICAVWGLVKKKRLAYIIAATSCIISIICLIISLIIYPVKFDDEVENDPGYQASTTDFSFDWTYGLAWAAVCFLIGATILLFIRVREEHDEKLMTSSAFGRELPPSIYYAA